MEKKNEEPCLSCKFISIGCLMSIGSYLIYQGKIQSKSKYSMYALGSAVIALGVGEIFDKSPFRQ